MSLTVSKFPAKLSGVRNPVVFEITTTNRMESYGYPGGGRLNWNDGMEVGNSFTLNWEGISLPFTCVSDASGDYTGLVLEELKGGETLEMWLTKTKGLFERNYLISRYFILYADLDRYFIDFTARSNGTEFEISGADIDCDALTSIVGNAGSANVPRPFYTIGMEIFGFNDSGDAVLLAEEAHEPDANSIALFDIAQYLEPLVQSDVKYPLSGGISTQRDKIIRPYFVRYFEQYGVIPVQQRVYTSSLFYAINGGIPSWKQVDFYKINESILNYLKGDDACFLTWRTHTRKTDRTAPEKLYLAVVDSAVAGEEITMGGSLIYNDLSSDEIGEVTVTESAILYKTYELDVSFAALGLGSITVPEGKWIIGWQVNVYSSHLSADSPMFELDERYYPQRRIFLWENSLGGVECMRFTGYSEEEEAYTRTLYDSNALLDHGNAGLEHTRMMQRGQLDPLSKRTMKASSGWITPEELATMPDFVRSRQVWELKDTTLYPVLITADKISQGKNNEYLKSVEITYEYLDMATMYQPDHVSSWSTGEFIENLT